MGEQVGVSGLFVGRGYSRVDVQPVPATPLFVHAIDGVGKEGFNEEGGEVDEPAVPLSSLGDSLDDARAQRKVPLCEGGR